MFQRIFAALDDSAGAHRALDEAIRLARSMHAAVTVVCVVVRPARLVDVGAGFVDPRLDMPSGVDVATEALAHARARLADARIDGDVRAIDADGDDIAAALMRAAAECDADLIVMGTHGRQGWKRLLLGSVAESLLRIADRPVLLWRADDAAHASGETTPA